MTEPLIDALYWAAGRWAFGRRPIEPVVRIACDLLVTGYDGESLVALAGLSVSEEDRGYDVLRTVHMTLEELGRPLPDEESKEARAIWMDGRQQLLRHAVDLLLKDNNAVYPALSLRIKSVAKESPDSLYVTDYANGGQGVFLNVADDLPQALWEVDQQLSGITLESWWSLTGQGDTPHAVCAEHPQSVLMLGEQEDIPVWVCSIGEEVIAPVGELSVAAEAGRVLPGLTA